jgi:hypothetical protein
LFTLVVIDLAAFCNNVEDDEVNVSCCPINEVAPVSLAVKESSLILASILLDRSPTQDDNTAELFVVNRPFMIAVLSSGVCLGSGGFGGPEGFAATFFLGGIL